MHAMTAAHKILPMNTMLMVENLDNGEAGNSEAGYRAGRDLCD